MEAFAATSPYSSYLTTTTATPAVSGEMGIWGIISLVLAIIGGILVYFLFVKSKTEAKGKFLKWLKEFLAFKTMWIEGIIKVTYYIMTIFIVLSSFGLISTSVLGFFITLILGPIIIRLIYEASIMFVMIWKNTADINKKMK